MKWCPCRNHIRATKNDARVDIWSDQIRRGHHSSQPSKQPSFYGGEIDSLPVIWFLSPSTRSYIRESSGLLPEACQKSLSKFSRLLVSFSILGDKFGWLLVWNDGNEQSGCPDVIEKATSAIQIYGGCPRCFLDVAVEATQTRFIAWCPKASRYAQSVY